MATKDIEQNPGTGKVSYNPVSIDEVPQPSPAEERSLEISLDKGVSERLKEARAIGPSVRQQTQAEILNLVLLYRELGANPFSVKRLPFSILRDMTADPTIGFCLYYIETPRINAQYIFESPDAQLAAAVDAAYRPINSDFISKGSNALGMGYQPMCKRWKLGPLNGSYRDKTSEEPDKDKPIWDSKNVDALLFNTPLALPPENCLPRWNEIGHFNGYMYSPVPIPNPMILGVAQTYGSEVLSGYPIPLEWAIWKTNERNKVFGSLYGSPRTKRAYRPWWSYWYRWALADRAFENTADPAKYIYFPTMVAEALDAGNPAAETPYSLQQKAIQAGNSMRSGTTTAFPGDFMVGEDGKTMNHRQWEPKYLEVNTKFSDLENSFSSLRINMMQAMFLPEQAFVDATMSGQTSSQRYISAQMGEIYNESQQLLTNEDDEIVNKYFIPEFIAANFPDKINVPCKKVTRKVRNPEFIKQLVTLLGQKNPESLPVDVRALLQEEGVPLNTEAQQALQEKKNKELLEATKPPVTAPTKTEGIAGYNAGVEKTETGEHIYFQPGDELRMTEPHQEFLSSLPKIPPYQDASVRSLALQARKLFINRYKKQLKSFADQIRNKTVLQLAQESQQGEGQGEQRKLSVGAAKIAAAGAVAAWVSSQSLSFPVDVLRLKDILAKIVDVAGKRELKLANLDSGVFDSSNIEGWVKKYADTNLTLMDETIHDEVREFLLDQLQQDSRPGIVAQSLEDHFSELPDTHSARAVRAQTRDAYNRGMLQAGIDAGVSQVMAHDASEGENQNTDPKCIKRNGKVFNLSDAMKETEHPNGTLWFSYLSTQNLSVEITDEIPDSLELGDMTAGYDSTIETLYIRPSAKDSENSYLLTLGERLKIR